MFPFVRPMNIHPPSAAAGGCPGYLYNTGDGEDDWEANTVSGTVTNSKQAGSLRSVLSSTSGVKDVYWSTVNKVTLTNVTTIRFNVDFSNSTSFGQQFVITAGYGNNKTSFVASNPITYTSSNFASDVNFQLTNVNATGDYHVSLRVSTDNSTSNGQVDINEVELICD
jgi:hypothetical protein